MITLRKVTWYNTVPILAMVRQLSKTHPSSRAPDCLSSCHSWCRSLYFGDIYLIEKYADTMTSRAIFIMEMQYPLKFVQGKFGVGNTVLEAFTPSWTFSSLLQVTKKFKATGVQQKYNWGSVLGLQEASVQDICLNVFYFSWGQGGMCLTKSRHHSYV